MRALLQLVKSASVRVEGEIIGEIGRGLLIFVGFEGADTTEDLEWIARKVMKMRIFQDEKGKMNRCVQDVSGEVFIVSQFTLHASTKKGNRPSFIYAAPPDIALGLYNDFITYMNENYDTRIATGKFGAMMQVELINDGPVTISMDSKNKE